MIVLIVYGTVLKKIVLAAALMTAIASPAGAEPGDCVFSFVKDAAAIAVIDLLPLPEGRDPQESSIFVGIGPKGIFCRRGGYCYPIADIQYIGPCSIDHEGWFYFHQGVQLN